jgi:hypothetical protein
MGNIKYSDSKESDIPNHEKKFRDWLMEEIKAATYLPQGSLPFNVHSEPLGTHTFKCPTLFSNCKCNRCFCGAYLPHENTSMSGNLYIDHWPSKNHKSDTVLLSILSSLIVERNFISVRVLSNEAGKKTVS